MTFEQWWATLTTREQARMVRADIEEAWNTATKAADEATEKIDALQAKIDALMLEYCPDEMTEEQKARWAESQVIAAQKYIATNQQEIGNES